MRVISGKYKGKYLQGFDIEGTRPTMDRVKESIFSMIQFEVVDSLFLDLFAGSGAIGIEALSMNAKMCYFIDCNPKAVNTIKKNLNKMEACYKLIKMDCFQALAYFAKENISFDIIFLDPPYNFKEKKRLLDYICNKKIIKNNGLVIFEYDDEDIKTDKLFLLKHKKYGSKKVDIYRKVDN